MRQVEAIIRVFVAFFALGIAGTVFLAQSMEHPDTDRRINSLEGLQLAGRLASLETRHEAFEARIGNIEKVGTGILVVVVTQLLLSGFQLRGRQK